MMEASLAVIKVFVDYLSVVSEMLRLIPRPLFPPWLDELWGSLWTLGNSGGKGEVGVGGGLVWDPPPPANPANLGFLGICPGPPCPP